MKNKYSFDLLTKQKFPSNEAEEFIFWKMLNILEKGTIKHSFDNLNELYSELSFDDYYIAHNLIASKGKRKIFKGRVFISKKNDLISFLNESFTINDVRCFLISPVSPNESEYVIYIDEEQIHLYCS
ncbi:MULTISPECIES: hypothetical protein [Escherichia]|uniref:Uncharacterized protein n=3 Tax=Escherichia TaxID=561 RepID=A0A7L5X9W8_9ESCH|nr:MULTISPECIES: hypothetical protein [Escherichia]EEV6996242.1 hypothetical protein [Escherichia coli]EEZ4480868.1 hypothetical protein [Escherichia coli]EFL5711233.1 hypothetical protein [Escherichia coli]EFO1477271.1 hypothetical protein [Escherichia coli]EOV43016.1 hypothetical protein A1SC_04377 [Escherichia sp. KTE52]